MLTGSVNKFSDLGHLEGTAPPPNFFMILNKKYTRLKGEMILKMIVIPLPKIKKIDIIFEKEKILNVMTCIISNVSDEIENEDRVSL